MVVLLLTVRDDSQHYYISRMKANKGSHGIIIFALLVVLSSLLYKSTACMGPVGRVTGTYIACRLYLSKSKVYFEHFLYYIIGYSFAHLFHRRL
jgi:hypothetical protein